MRYENLILQIYDRVEHGRMSEANTLINDEIRRCLDAYGEPRLGLATTKQLLDELIAREEHHGTINYRTIDS